MQCAMEDKCNIPYKNHSDGVLTIGTKKYSRMGT
jgi:hypothetical protein